MSEHEHEHEHENTAGIPDEQLPPDLVAGEDNPLAEGLPDGEGEGLLEEGKPAEEPLDPEVPAHAGDDREKRSGPAEETD